MLRTLKVGDRLDTVVVVAKKVRRDFSGGKFLLFQFATKEGSLKGVQWEPPAEVERGIQVDDVVRVRGEIQDYQGSLQLKVSSIEKLDELDYDPSLFLPVSERSGQDLYEDLLGIISSMENAPLRSLLEAIFGDEGFRKNFLRAPAAKGWHHSYVGGLAEHVHDMARIAERTAEVYLEVDRDLLLAGVLLHDLGKLQELSVTNHIDYSDRGRLLGHITMGVEFVGEYIRGIENFPDELEVELKHMILSHHGTLENGSPVLPMSIEALLLHYIDNMDAQVRGVLQILGKADRAEGKWTEYVRFLDRFIYRRSGELDRMKMGREEENDG
ncbi:MAG: HD domain-containing protein [bacterium]|nr:MAG: HD domain-containing protein [bacterium]